VATLLELAERVADMASGTGLSRDDALQPGNPSDDLRAHSERLHPQRPTSTYQSTRRYKLDVAHADLRFVGVTANWSRDRLDAQAKRPACLAVEPTNASGGCCYEAIDKGVG